MREVDKYCVTLIKVKESVAFVLYLSVNNMLKILINMTVIDLE